jgi:large subunit ribosomal protein L21
VSPGEEVKLEKLPGEIGDPIAFDKVMIVSDGENVQIGEPYLENTSVVGRLTRHGKNRKIIVFKYKRRKNYRKKRGHRQLFSMVKIEGIEP